MFLRIQTVRESADEIDQDACSRFFDFEGQLTAGQVAAALGFPGMTLARDDFVYDEDDLLPAKDDLFTDPATAAGPALRLYSDE